MAKYSKEQRRCAVELYVRYECCVADVIRELGFPVERRCACGIATGSRSGGRGLAVVWRRCG